MQATSLLLKFNLHERKAAIKVKNGPKTTSGKPTGLKRFAAKTPSVSPTTAYTPKR